MDLKQALILIFAGIGGTLGFSLIFRMRKKLIVWSLLGAALTLGVYVLCLATMQHAFFQNLFPALVGALFAEVTAKLTKSPATQFCMEDRGRFLFSPSMASPMESTEMGFG